MLTFSYRGSKVEIEFTLDDWLGYYVMDGTEHPIEIFMKNENN